MATYHTRFGKGLQQALTLQLARHGNASYRIVAGSLTDLGSHLVEHGFIQGVPTSPHEHSRYLQTITGQGRAIVVVYHTGTILLQGCSQCIGFARSILTRLVRQEVAA